MNIGKAFKQMFQDPKWVKKMLFYILFLFLSIFLIGIPFVSGYTVLILNNYLQGKENLPEWEGNWEVIFMTGLKFCCITLLLGVLTGIVSFFTTGVLNLASTILLDIEGLEIVGLFLSLLQMILSFIVSFVVSILTSVVSIKFAKNLSFSEVFDFDWYVEFIKKSWKNLLIVSLVALVFAPINFIGFFALCIGVLVTTFYTAVTNAALLAGVARAAGEGNDSVNNSNVEEVSPVSAPTMISAKPA